MNRRGQYWLWILIPLTILVMGLMGWVFYTGDRLINIHSPNVDATMEIRLETANAHLWFEEIMTGDHKIEMSVITSHLDEAEWYVHALLKGGENPEGRFLPLQHPELRTQVGRIQNLLDQLRSATQARFQLGEEAGIGSSIDQQYDQIYQKLMTATDAVEQKLQDKIRLENRHFENVQVGVISVVLILFIGAAFIFHRFERQRTQTMIEISREKQRAEQSEKWLYTTMESMGDGVIVTDGDGKVTYLNPVASSLTGWKGEFKGIDITKVFHIVNEETRQPAENIVARVLEEKLVIGLANHTLLISKDNREIPIADSAAPIISPNGKILGTVLIFRDVTGERDRERELADLRHMLENVVDSMPSVLVAVDPDGHVLQWNREAEIKTGVSRNEAKGQLIDEIMPQMSSQMEQIKSAITQRQVKKDQKIPHSHEGEEGFSDIMIYPLITNGVNGAVVRVDDVTDRVRVEELMIQTEKMATVGGLAAGMAHEINNPLGTVLMGVQSTLRRVSPDLPKNNKVAEACGTGLNVIREYMEERSIFEYLENIRQGGERASEIVAQMLSFSRKSESVKTPAELSLLLDESIHLASTDYDLKKTYDFRHIQMDREEDKSLPPILCEKNQIEQVLLNLFKNAAQAMPIKSEDYQPRILIKTSREKNFAKLEITDNGPGMEEGVRKKIFEPFYTTKGIGKGTGLGLSVSYFIITENHGGRITVDSTPGEGTTFTIHLPLMEANND